MSLNRAISDSGSVADKASSADLGSCWRGLAPYLLSILDCCRISIHAIWNGQMVRIRTKSLKSGKASLTYSGNRE
jgi:hypothetical protein